MYSPDAVAAPSARAVGARVCVDVCACTRSAQGEASIASRIDATGQMTLGRSHTRAQMQRAHHARRRRGIVRFEAAQLGALLHRASTSTDTRAYCVRSARLLRRRVHLQTARALPRGCCVERVHAHTSTQTRAPTARALGAATASGEYICTRASCACAATASHFIGILRPELIRAYSL